METQTRILHAAEACFAQTGYQGTSIQQIAQAAGVSPAVIYRYYPGKRALFEALQRPELDFRDPERVEREQQIVRAALEIFGRHGFNAATMDEIAAAAGLTKGGLYAYFSSKEALFNAVLDQAPVILGVAAAAAHPPATPQDYLTALAEAYLAAYENENTINLMRVILSEGMHNPAVGSAFVQRAMHKWSGQLGAALAGALPLNQAELTLRMQLYFGMLFSWVLVNRLLPQAQAPAPLSAEERRTVAAKIAQVFCGGLLTPPNADDPKEWTR